MLTDKSLSAASTAARAAASWQSAVRFSGAVGPRLCPGVGSRQQQEPVHQVRRVPCSRKHLPHRFPQLLSAAVAPQRELSGRLDQRERRAQLVGGIGRELPEL